MVQASFPHLLLQWRMGPISRWKMFHKNVPLATIVNRSLSLDGKVDLRPELDILPDSFSDAESLFPREVTIDNINSANILVIKDEVLDLEELAKNLFWPDNNHLKDAAEVVSLIRKISNYRRGGKSLFRDEVDTMEAIFDRRAKSNEDFVKKAEEIASEITNNTLSPKITAAEKIMLSRVANPSDYILITESYLHRITSSIDEKTKLLTGILDVNANRDGFGALKSNYFIIEYGVGSVARTYGMRLLLGPTGVSLKFIAGISNPSRSLAVAGSLLELEKYFVSNSTPYAYYTPAPAPAADRYVSSYNNYAPKPHTIEDLKAILVPLDATRLDSMSIFKINPTPIDIKSIPIHFEIKYNPEVLLDFTEIDLSCAGLSNTELDEMKNVLVSACETPIRKLKKGTIKAEKLEVLSTYLAGLYKRISPLITSTLEQEFTNNKIMLSVLHRSDVRTWDDIRRANVIRNSKVTSEIEKDMATYGEVGRWSSVSNFLNMMQNNNKDIGLSKSLFTRIGLAAYKELQKNPIYADANLSYKCDFINSILYVYINNRITGGTHFKWWEKDTELAPIDEQLMNYFERRGDRIIFYLPKMVTPKGFCV